VNAWAVSTIAIHGAKQRRRGARFGPLAIVSAWDYKSASAVTERRILRAGKPREGLLLPARNSLIRSRGISLNSLLCRGLDIDYTQVNRAFAPDLKELKIEDCGGDKIVA